MRVLRVSRGSNLLSVVAMAVVVASGAMMQDKPDIPGGDGGLSIPGLGNATPDPCTVTTSDPRNKNSCNVEGGNGSDGEPGTVEGHGKYRDYHDTDKYQRYEDYQKYGAHPDSEDY